MTAAPTDDPKVVKMNRQKAKRGTSWKDNLSLNDKGTPKACLANAICNDLQSSAARPAIIGRKLSTFGETIGGVKPELNETQPALRETNPHSSAWDRNPSDVGFPETDPLADNELQCSPPVPLCYRILDFAHCGTVVLQVRIQKPARRRRRQGHCRG
jgi:hypothetical protein